MSDLMNDTKITDGSLFEKDIQAGSSEEIHIDPVAEKKVNHRLALLAVFTDQIAHP
jgi:hypothetical protein